jgi:hypothetical protein
MRSEGTFVATWAGPPAPGGFRQWVGEVLSTTQRRRSKTKLFMSSLRLAISMRSEGIFVATWGGAPRHRAFVGGWPLSRRAPPGLQIRAAFLDHGEAVLAFALEEGLTSTFGAISWRSWGFRSGRGFEC